MELLPFQNLNMCDVSRFVIAQEKSYEKALAEIKAGHKKSHWVWYIFPQIAGIGHLSRRSRYYSIKGLNEARAYYLNPYLRGNLISITLELLKIDKRADEIMGQTDAVKLKSCMTLFDFIQPNDVFGLVLTKFFNGERCELTLSEIGCELSNEL